MSKLTFFWSRKICVRYLSLRILDITCITPSYKPLLSNTSVKHLTQWHPTLIYLSIGRYLVMSLSIKQIVIFQGLCNRTVFLYFRLAFACFRSDQREARRSLHNRESCCNIAALDIVRQRPSKGLLRPSFNPHGAVSTLRRYFCMYEKKEQRVADS